MQLLSVAEPRVHEWTREEYYKLGAGGLFDQRRVELIEGVVVDMSPIGPEHATSVTAADDVLRDVFGKGWVVRVQSPLALGEQSDPQPDIAVVAGSRRDYRQAHPTTAALIVEVADSTVDYDRKVKASLYAKAGIPDYWMLNIGARQIEVYRDPQPDATKPYGYGYATALKLKAGESIAPLVQADAKILVNDLLP